MEGCSEEAERRARTLTLLPTYLDLLLRADIRTDAHGPATHDCAGQDVVSSCLILSSSNTAFKYQPMLSACTHPDIDAHTNSRGGVEGSGLLLAAAPHES